MAPLTDLVDSHCHLQLRPGEMDLGPIEATIAAARAVGVREMLVPGTDGADSATAVALAAGHAGIFAAAGFHPHEASRLDAAAETAIERLLGEPQVVAVGEIGLDFHYNHSPREDQLRALRRQLAMARAAGLPVILHNRESGQQMIEVLREPESAGIRGVFHSFCDDAVIAREALALGFYLSYSGMVTFKPADNVRATVPLVPEDRILIETDTPYLAPVPNRGKPNQPAFVEFVARQVAVVRGVDAQVLATASRRNFFALFTRAA